MAGKPVSLNASTISSRVVSLGWTLIPICRQLVSPDTPLQIPSESALPCWVIPQCTKRRSVLGKSIEVNTPVSPWISSSPTRLSVNDPGSGSFLRGVYRDLGVHLPLLVFGGAEYSSQGRLSSWTVSGDVLARAAITRTLTLFLL